MSTRQVPSEDGRPAPRLHPSSQAPELATAILEGLERRGIAAVEDAIRGLRSEANVLAVAPVARPTPWRGAVVLLRRFAHALVRPWLAVQSEFNESVLHALSQLTHEVEVLSAARLEGREAGRSPDDQGSASSTPEIGIERRQPGRSLLEAVFAHSRLPAPPARVLLLAKDAGVFRSILPTFGFEVIDPDRTVPDASVDAAIAFGLAEQAPIDRIASLLRPAGRLIATIPLRAVSRAAAGSAAQPAAEVEALLQPLHCIEILFCAPEGESWELLHDAAGLPETRAGAFALVVAERT